MNMNMPRVVHYPGLKAVTNSRGLLGTSYQETKSINRFLLHWQRLTECIMHRSGACPSLCLSVCPVFDF